MQGYDTRVENLWDKGWTESTLWELIRVVLLLIARKKFVNIT
jgi:hypothetical protein